MVRKDSRSAQAGEVNRRVRDALQQCRELMKRTEDLIERSYRIGGPRED